jgi:hypothetical protein
MWSNKASGGNGGSSFRSKRANISGYLGKGSSSKSHSLLEDDDDDDHCEASSLSSLDDEQFNIQGQAVQPPGLGFASSPQNVGSSSDSSSSLPPIEEDGDDNSTVRKSRRKIVEMDGNSLDLDDIEEAYMLSVWSNADVGVGGLGGGSATTASTRSLSTSSLSSGATGSTTNKTTRTTPTTRSSRRHGGAARKRLLREEQHAYDPTTTQGWVASFQVAAEIHNCGDWEPQTGFFKRQPFPLANNNSASSSTPSSTSNNNNNNSVWHEPTPFDYCKKERIEV